jgi:hypothetical protein
MMGSFCPLPHMISQHTRPLPQDFDSSHSTSNPPRLSHNSSRALKSSNCFGVTGMQTLFAAFGGSLRQQISLPVSQVLLPHTMCPGSGRGDGEFAKCVEVLDTGAGCAMGSAREDPATARLSLAMAVFPAGSGLPWRFCAGA